MRKLWRGRVKFQLATTWSARSRDKSTTWVHPVLSTTLSCHMFRFVQHLGHPRLSSGRLAEDVAFFFGLTRLLKVPGCRPFSPLVFFFFLSYGEWRSMSRTTSRPLKTRWMKKWPGSRHFNQLAHVALSPSRDCRNATEPPRYLQCATIHLESLLPKRF